MDKQKQWIRQIKLKSNEVAANELIYKYYKEIYAYIYKQTLNKELSMDLTQEIFINMLQSINNYDEGKAAFRTWLYKIATNKLMDYYRSRNYKYNTIVMSINDYDLHDTEDFTINIENKQEAQNIINIANRFDASSQLILRLKIFAQYTFLEISEVFNISESTVKTRYYSIIKKVKIILGEDKNG
ncbi:sigma-70 family RNA polymerase sigma factor [Clostridium tagluense]|uniref:RNA polymerase sigma factor n=1 Tax=Clostridium tagluense TaxID=360422 RepID=UPI001CF2D197|nr:sigma-70 family RNA polymerase sigma factor [Clostridium tagluense]MCB2312297.1 sigma-70 family RNA polymerase sigma factor [Clostridium tagluense]MCB2316965.1 sigma-70 family RNA polymerase sigma factor [Clostridium tagluense]MCB2321836.1 sigma-70 family RNA polymerase sigma factor [Clostridium tagluense]MCB2326744.1 sigma-70 family RNA polymerase sigma factor [Clostridium tagluense]MCB2331557.1 sigma-70 family RNA polymerase sigma factor [Clostridium tagluense]